MYIYIQIVDFEFILVLHSYIYILEVQIRTYVYMFELWKFKCFYSIYTQHCTFRKGFIASTFGCNDNGEQNSNCDEAESKNHLKTNQQLTHQIFASWIQHIYSYISEEVVCLSERDLQILNSVSSCTHIYEWNLYCRLGHFCCQSFSLFGILRMEDWESFASLKVRTILKMHIYI